MPTSLDIEKFLEDGKKSIIIDVRTPAEFAQGHIPGAFNIPLFTNEERAIVGTLYKKTGRQEAIHKGLEIFGPRMTWYIEELKKHVDLLNKNGNSLTENTIYVHCWRGGMRSGSMAWLFEIYGYRVFTLKKGYKAFRQFVFIELGKERMVSIVGGRTGSAKTLVLGEIKKLGKQVIDLEKLAHHKGSSFGNIGELPQPSQEHFENKLAMELMNTNSNENLFLEDESKLIGIRMIPKPLFYQMRACPVFYCEVSFEERVKYITDCYGKYPKEELIEATQRILRKLDTRYSKDAMKYLEEGNLIESFKISLRYYDKTYDFGLSKRDENLTIKISFDKINPKEMAQEICSQYNLWKK